MADKEYRSGFKDGYNEGFRDGQHTQRMMQDKIDLKKSKKKDCFDYIR
ncbi:MAG: hypothetical protein Q8S32_12190 [Burkholderiaceae bacterium]|nr:hypothetical protein [Burkholderiaceae bacterium]